MLKIHKNFKLNQKSFQNINDLEQYLKLDFPVDYQFLSELFDENSYINVYTSGSTGNPKSIIIPKTALLKSAEATGEFFKLPQKTTALHCLSSQFIAGKMMWVRALHLGWHLTLVVPNANPLKNKTESFDFAAMVPLQAQNSIDQLHQIKKLIIGGASLSAEWEEKLRQTPNHIYQTYGMTETITHIAVKKLGEKYYSCLPNVFISSDERDCLVIELPYLSSQKIITNDLVKLVTKHSFEWLGRYDHIINSGGIKLIPEKIEEKLHPYIPVPFFIAGLPDKNLGQKLILIIEITTQTLDFQSIFSKASLSKYEIPKEIYKIDAMIQTQNNKINRIDTLSLINK